MGLLERFRPTADPGWRPPALGLCRCESHVEDLLEERIDRADGSGSVAAAEIIAGGAMTTFPSSATALYLHETGGERRGPFHWHVLCEGGLQAYVSPDAPIGLDDALHVQPGVERVWWRVGTDIGIGAPSLCARGVQGAVVRALLNPRLRTA